MKYNSRSLSYLKPIVDNEDEEYHNRNVYPLLWSFQIATENLIPNLRKRFLFNNFKSAFEILEPAAYAYHVMPIFRRFASFHFLLNRIISLENSFFYDWCDGVVSGVSYEVEDASQTDEHDIVAMWEWEDSEGFPEWDVKNPLDKTRVSTLDANVRKKLSLMLDWYSSFEPPATACNAAPDAVPEPHPEPDVGTDKPLEKNNPICESNNNVINKNLKGDDSNQDWDDNFVEGNWKDYEEYWHEFSDLFMNPFMTIVYERDLLSRLYLFQKYVQESSMVFWFCWEPLDSLCKNFLSYKIYLENSSSLLPKEQWLHYKHKVTYLSTCLRGRWGSYRKPKISKLQIIQILHWFIWRKLRFMFGVDSLLRANIVLTLKSAILQAGAIKIKKAYEAKQKELKEMSALAYEKIKHLRDDKPVKEEEKESSPSLDSNLNTQGDSNILITDEDVATVLSNWTGVPVNKMKEPDLRKLEGMEDELKKKIIGQNVAVSSVCNAIQGARSGLRNPNRPIASFLFAGPTGVGKTQLAKELAKYFFNTDNAIIRLDMSEFMEKQTFSKLIGAPPGYLGYDEGGQLTEAVRKKPYSMVLFDEIEKAHPDVFNLLLQILEDGRLTDSQGRTVDFKNTIIVLTSNIGTQKDGYWFLDYSEDEEYLGFFDEEILDDEYMELIEDVMTELRQCFRPEFLNRLDEMVVFRRLSFSNLDDIADLMLNELSDRVKEKSIELEITKAARYRLVDLAYFDMDYGARPLRRVIAKKIEDRLATEYLNARSKVGTTSEIRIKVDTDKRSNDEFEIQSY